MPNRSVNQVTDWPLLRARHASDSLPEPIEAAVSGIRKYNRSLISEHLERLSLPIDTSELAHTLTAGKHLRSMCALAFTAAYGTQSDMLGDTQLLHAGAALELLHASSLVHDDIIDASSTRRGKPTVHRVLCDGNAILLGDLLVALAFQEASLVGSTAAAALAHAFTELCAGQLSESQLPWGPEAPRAVEQYAAQKTGALFGAAWQLGAIVADVPVSEHAQVRSAGVQLGIAFQLADDLFDAQSDAHDLYAAAEHEKDQGTDLRNGIPTLPIWLAHRELRARNSDATNSGMENGTATASTELADIAASEGVRQQVVHRIDTLVTEAYRLLPVATSSAPIVSAILRVLQGVPEIRSKADERSPL